MLICMLHAACCLTCIMLEHTQHVVTCKKTRFLFWVLWSENCLSESDLLFLNFISATSSFISQDQCKKLIFREQGDMHVTCSMLLHMQHAGAFTACGGMLKQASTIFSYFRMLKNCFCQSYPLFQNFLGATGALHLTGQLWIMQIQGTGWQPCYMQHVFELATCWSVHSMWWHAKTRLDFFLYCGILKNCFSQSCPLFQNFLSATDALHVTGNLWKFEIQRTGR